MDQEFWHQRWEQNQIGFHQQEINHYLATHWAELGLAAGDPVFVPLCGKSLDMLWLREQGHPVFGVELSPKAVQAFFDENQLEPRLREGERFTEYWENRLCVFAGDFFALRREDLGAIRAVYDRASLVALPPPMRERYARHMAELLNPGAHILLITMEYPQESMDGPPFSVPEEEIHSLFGVAFDIERKAEWAGQGPRGVAVTEKIYTLTRNGSAN